MNTNKKLFEFFLIFTLCLVILGYATSFLQELIGVLKVITAIQYTIFLSFAFLFNMIVGRYKNKIIEHKEFIITIAFFVLMATGYEVLWNFFFWFSNYGFYGIPGTNENIDLLQYTPYQTMNLTFLNATGLNVTGLELVMKTKPINLNIASKLVFLMFFCDLYLLCKIVWLEEEKIKLGDKTASV